MITSGLHLDYIWITSGLHLVEQDVYSLIIEKNMSRQNGDGKWICFTPEKRKRIYERDHGRCWMCGKEIGFDRLSQVDHIIPFCLGGDESDINLRLICHKCNALRGAYARRIFSKIKEQRRNIANITPIATRHKMPQQEVIYKAVEMEAKQKGFLSLKQSADYARVTYRTITRIVRQLKGSKSDRLMSVFVGGRTYYFIDRGYLDLKYYPQPPR